jgi:SNF family Na+-dependent transporter
MALVCVVNKSQFDFWNNFAGNYGFIVTAGLGAIFFNYLYGTKRIREEFLNDGGDIQLGSWFDPLVKCVAVPFMLIIMADSLFPFL